MLEIKNLNVYIKNKHRIKDLSLVLNKGDKLAIIGEEGSGKSTLFKIITNSFDYGEYTGHIKTNCKIGYLEQHISERYNNYMVYDFLWETADYYEKIGVYTKLKSELQLNDDIENSLIKNLSGGEKVKVGLLKLLLEDSEILLLDEPSNDVDLETLVWLENFIKDISKPVMFISHDESFLENTANRVLLLEMLCKKTLPNYELVSLEYNDFVQNREHMIERTASISKKEKESQKKQLERINQIKNKVEHRQNTITRADPHGGKMLKRKMQSVLATKKRIENTDITKTVDHEDEINMFFNNVNIPNSKKIIEYKDEKLIVQNKVLLNNFNLSIFGNSHVVIVGNNGSGKTTLLKRIYHDVKERADIKVGYMPQNYEEALNHKITPIDYLCNNRDKNEVSLIRSYLGNLKFTHEEMVDRIENLSGGTKAKLILLKLIYSNYNVLILDEPTRNVSPLSSPIIRKALRDYKGAIISVSHDRKYIETCDIVYEIVNGELIKR